MNETSESSKKCNVIRQASDEKTTKSVPLLAYLNSIMWLSTVVFGRIFRRSDMLKGSLSLRRGITISIKGNVASVFEAELRGETRFVKK